MSKKRRSRKSALGHFDPIPNGSAGVVGKASIHLAKIRLVE